MAEGDERVPIVYSASNPAPQYPGETTGHYPTPVRSALSVNAAINPMAFYGFVASIFGVFFNPFLVPSILGIVLSARGIAKSNVLRATGDSANLRTLAIAGVCIGIVGCVIGIAEGASWAWAVISSFSVNFE